jgi:hypothetical protein
LIKVTRRGVVLLGELFTKHNIDPVPNFAEWPLDYGREVVSLIRSVMEDPVEPPLSSDQLQRLLAAAGVWDDPSTLPEHNLP